MFSQLSLISNQLNNGLLNKNEKLYLRSFIPPKQEETNRSFLIQSIVTNEKSFQKKERMQKIENTTLIGLKNALEKLNSPQFALPT